MLPDARGGFCGLPVETCRAIVAAILSNATKMRCMPTTSQLRYTAMQLGEQLGEVDRLAHDANCTPERAAQLGLAFASIGFHDGRGFMVEPSAGVTSGKELDGATICMQPGRTTEPDLAVTSAGSVGAMLRWRAARATRQLLHHLRA